MGMLSHGLRSLGHLAYLRSGCMGLMLDGPGSCMLFDHCPVYIQLYGLLLFIFRIEVFVLGKGVMSILTRGATSQHHLRDVSTIPYGSSNKNVRSNRCTGSAFSGERQDINRAIAIRWKAGDQKEENV